jgi:hypothetical protein
LLTAIAVHAAEARIINLMSASKTMDLKLKALFSTGFKRPNHDKRPVKEPILTTVESTSRTEGGGERDYPASFSIQEIRTQDRLSDFACLPNLIPEITLTDRFDEKPFNFLCLPGEVRNRIYELVLEHGSCKIWGDGCRHLQLHLHLNPRDRHLPAGHTAVRSLLSSSKQIRSEFGGLYSSTLQFVLHPSSRKDISLFKPWLHSFHPSKIHLRHLLTFDRNGNSLNHLGPEVAFSTTMLASFDLTNPKTKVSVTIDNTTVHTTLPKKDRDRWARWLALMMNMPLSHSHVTDFNARLEEVMAVFTDEVFEWFVRWGEYQKS